MTNHTPMLDDATFSCPACGWRAVLASDNRIFQTAHGDAGYDHIGQALAQRDAILALRCVETARVLCRLRDHYDARTLTIRQLQRLTRAVIGEHA